MPQDYQFNYLPESKPQPQFHEMLCHFDLPMDPLTHAFWTTFFDTPAKIKGTQNTASKTQS
jgi:hypothetical protein